MEHRHMTDKDYEEKAIRLLKINALRMANGLMAASYLVGIVWILTKSWQLIIG